MRSRFSKLPWKTTGDKEEEQDCELVNMAKEIGVDASVAVVLSEVDGISTSKENSRTALKALLCAKDIFALLPSGFGQSLGLATGP